MRPTSRQIEPVSYAVVSLRRFLGETQKQFAKRMGVTPLTVARWETSRPPTRYTLQRIYEVAMVNKFPESEALCFIEGEAARQIVQQLADFNSRQVQRMRQKIKTVA